MIVSRTRRVAMASLAIAATLVGTSLVATLVACERAQPPERAGGTATNPATSAPATSPAVSPSTHDTTAMAVAPPPTLADTADPAATLRAYLARARMHRATRDTLVWEPATDGASGFRAFADSTIATFTVGSAGRIDAAAGSRYVTIPVTVDIVTGAAPVTLHGTATLRRAVVDGASEAQRRWRIVRIEWGAPR